MKLAASLSVLVIACSPTPALPEAGTDAAVSADAREAGCAKCADAMPMCPTPLDVSTYMPETLPDALGKHLKQCSQAELDLYHKCVIDSDKAACMTITAGAATTYKDCLAC